VNRIWYWITTIRLSLGSELDIGSSVRLFRGGLIPKDYLFMLEFDDVGFLKRFERTGTIWTSAETRLDKWTPPGIEKTPSVSRESFMIDPAPQAHAKPARSDVARRSLERGILLRMIWFKQPFGHKVAAFG
jgi:hypothetical protein